MSDEQKDIGDELKGNGTHPHINIAICILKVIFFIYDILVYIPFKIFADPVKKLEFSSRVKASPETKGDAATPWRRKNETESHFDGTTFPGCHTVAEQWVESVKRYNDMDCFGTREVLEVHKEKQPNGRIFEKWELGEYQWRSYETANRRVNMVASGLKNIGHKEGFVVLFAETREEWMTTALACFKNNFPIVTVYATLGEEAVEFAINEVEATTIFTSQTLLPKVKKAIANGVKINRVIYFESQDPVEREQVQKHPEGFMNFDDLLKEGSPDDVPLKAKADDLALIMYTSGTTGNPKGVMITHKNIITAAAGQGSVIPINAGETYIGYLPLAHILEVCAEMVVLAKGVRIGYSSAQTLFDRAPKIKKGTKGDCYALKPTLIACVPAVMDRIYKAVIDEVNSKSLFFREMFRTCYERKRARYEEGYSSFILNKLVFNHIGKLLGGNVRIVLSGGAPLSPETQRFMNICFCCPVVQGYGLTETCGAGAIADTHDLSTGAVGPPLLGCEILLEEWKEAGYHPNNGKPQGEILLGGDIVAKGYYKNEEKTKEDFVIRKGRRYFATGDIGEFREDGSLKIIDRKKDLLKLAHGEYISLGKVETHLLTNPLVDNVCVYGESDKDFLVALLVPNHKNLAALLEDKGINESDIEKACANKEVAALVQKALEQYTFGKLQRVEIPKKVHLCAEAWTPAAGLLTEALKLKRKNIEKEFRKELDDLYK